MSIATAAPTERTRNDRPAAGVDGASIVLVEPRALNRHFLEDWLRSCWPSLDVLAVADPAALAGCRKALRRARFSLVSIGQQRVAAAATLEALERVRRLAPAVPLVVLAERELVDDIVLAIRAGARGFVPTSLDRGAAARAIEFVLAGGTFVPAGVLAGLGTVGAATAVAEAPRLTPRELQVARLICAGRPNKLIAHELRISEATVKVFVRKILSKLRVHNRTEAALAARRHFAADLAGEGPVEPAPEEDGTAPARITETAG